MSSLDIQMSAASIVRTFKLATATKAEDIALGPVEWQIKAPSVIPPRRNVIGRYPKGRPNG
jgi:hypothetical protein